MRLPDGFRHPSREFAPWPFWFLNDRLEAGELRKQVRDFAAHGVGGLVLHPRLGLPRDQGWMSEPLLEALETAIEECANRGLKVVLYDEGMYPSGSASGCVVAEDPTLAARGICRRSVGFTVTEDENVLAQNDEWMVIERPVASVVRGLHYRDELAATEDLLPAANLLDPRAVDAFIRHSYDRYAERFARWFGDPIVGIITDEPSPLSRCGEPDVLPWVPGLVANHDLPRLWTDDTFRAQYRDLISDRFAEVYWSKLHEWCERHGIWLMGHPDGPADFAAMRHMHIPGQDMVWRWVEPWSDSATEGAQSTQAIAAVSIARQIGAPRCSDEFGGAYGEDLTFQEFQSLAWWLIVRGINLLIPHAFYYSMTGPRRTDRPPDVGPHSKWWDQWPDFAATCARLCWINTGEEWSTPHAILAPEHSAPWLKAAERLSQRSAFHYVTPSALGQAEFEGQSFRVGKQHYAGLVLDDFRPRDVIQIFRERGGQIVGNQITVTPFISGPKSLRTRQTMKDGFRWLIAFQEADQAAMAELESGWWEVSTTDGELIDEAGGPLALDPLELRLFVRPL